MEIITIALVLLILIPIIEFVRYLLLNHWLRNTKICKKVIDGSIKSSQLSVYQHVPINSDCKIENLKSSSDCYYNNSNKKRSILNSYLITVKKMIGFKDFNHYKYFLIEYPLIILNEWTKKQEVDTVVLINNRKCIKVDYYHRGEKRKMFLPYSTINRFKWKGYKVVLTVQNPDGVEEQIDITHDPGLGYNFTPKMMGGIKATIEKDGKKVIFLEDQYITIS